MTPLAAYTPAHWDQEFLAIFARRTAPQPCPQCRRTGFFGPRKAGDRTYRLCKFCGAYQATGGPMVQCLATVHNCQQWLTVAGAPYIWWVQPHETQHPCPYCGASVQVAAARVKRPVEDPGHAWWRVPQNMSFDEAARFWVQQGAARVYL